MQKLNILKPILLLLLVSFTRSNAQTFQEFSADFVKQYKSFNIPQLEMSYVDGFKRIDNKDKLLKELEFFKNTQAGLLKLKLRKLTEADLQDYTQIKYEAGLNIERLQLELEWLNLNDPKIAETSIADMPNGKAWYRYLLKKWLSADVTPDEIYTMGVNEVGRVKRKIEEIRLKSQKDFNSFYRYLNDPSFFTSDPNEVQAAFEEARVQVYKNLSKIFYSHRIPPLKILRGENERLAQAPGYYDNSTFYYNMTDQPYNKRQVDWLFIHEGVPGHHFQSSIYASHNDSEVQQLFYYLGLAEGWAAYVEEYGEMLGLYRTPYDALGKWQWDLVRSVRVPMDIGLNYLGWTDEKALAYWKSNITGQDDIAMREIERVKRWPAQAITYKYGALQLMEWKAALTKKQGTKFDIKGFHDKVLNYGSLPMFMVKANVMEEH